MEKYYVKRGKRYIEAGYNVPNLCEGIYFHQKTKFGSRTTSLNWWVGSAPSEPIDTKLLIQIMRIDEDLSNWLMKIQQNNSDEYKQFKENSLGFIKDNPKIYNVSVQDLSVGILRLVYESLKNADTSKT